MYDEILFPTDGSEPANGAADHAFELASTYRATLHVLYVLKTNEPPPQVEDPAADDDPDARGKAAVEETAERAAAQGIEAVEAIVRGPTADAIVTYADEHGIDLIVMGTHGRTGLDRILIGSVADEVTRSAPVPVMTYHPPGD